MRGKVVGDAFGLGLEGKGALVGQSEAGRVVFEVPGTRTRVSTTNQR